MLTEKSPFSLYVHIPYCVTKCPYCDFNVHVVSSIPEQEYADALLTELESYAASSHWCGRALKSVYFGGGTPSTFDPISIGRILTKAAGLFTFKSDIEITLEANPGKEASARFPGYRSRGVNRVSIGAQSFQPGFLTFLGRTHSAEDAGATLRAARGAGFNNINLDLMFSLPGQSHVDLGEDLKAALSLEPTHVSAYNLTIEEGTPFYRASQKGKIRPLPEEEEIAMAELVEESFSEAGIERYEISNYARPGFHSRHNLNYWEGGDYLGIGAGAHSFKQLYYSGSFGTRWHNEKHPGRYMNRVREKGIAMAETETADLQRAAGEFMLTGLRMVQGVLIDEFSRRFGKTPGEFYPLISALKEDGLMEENELRLRLTRRGLLVANSVFINFV